MVYAPDTLLRYQSSSPTLCLSCLRLFQLTFTLGRRCFAAGWTSSCQMPAKTRAGPALRQIPMVTSVPICAAHHATHTIGPVPDQRQSMWRPEAPKVRSEQVFGHCLNREQAKRRADAGMYDQCNRLRRRSWWIQQSCRELICDRQRKVCLIMAIT